MSFDENYLDYTVVDMYKRGYSVKKISDYVFSYYKRNMPKNQFCGFCDYTKLDCTSYVIHTLLNRNRSVV